MNYNSYPIGVAYSYTTSKNAEHRSASSQNGCRSVLRREVTALDYAVHSNSIRCLKLLLREGANRDIKDMNGKKPIHFAKYYNYGECISVFM